MNSPLPQKTIQLMTIQINDLMDQRNQTCASLAGLNKKYQEALEKATSIIKNTDDELINITDYLKTKLSSEVSQT